MPPRGTEEVLRHLRRGVSRSEATTLAGMSRSSFYAELRRSLEFRKAVLHAESEGFREYGFRRSSTPDPVALENSIPEPPDVVSFAVAVLPLLLGLALLALGVAPGQVQLSW